MTRINCVPPAELCRQHLVAEYRELPRVFSGAQRAIQSGYFPLSAAPETYRLGAGHVRFFYARLEYCAHRHALLVSEMRARGYRPTIVRPDIFWRGLVPAEYWQDWEPTPEALALCRARIAERLPRSFAI